MFLYLFKEYLLKQKNEYKIEIGMWKYVKSNRYKNEHMHYITKKYYANEQSFRDCIANNQVADLACLLLSLILKLFKER